MHLLVDYDADGQPEINQLIKLVIEEESLIYLAGYVAHRFRAKYAWLGKPTCQMPRTVHPTWLYHVSRGSLIYPCDMLIEVAQILERVFNTFHNDSLSDTDLIFQKVAALVKIKINKKFTVADEVLLCLVRTRTYIRLRHLNKMRADAYDKIRIISRCAKTQKFFS